MISKGFSAEYTVPSRITESSDIGMGYIHIGSNKRPHGRTIVLMDEHNINIDVDTEGRIIGIEVFDHKMLPPPEIET